MATLPRDCADERKKEMALTSIALEQRSIAAQADAY
jgi:hypothetical protein